MQVREDLALANEPCPDFGIDEPLPDNLDRHLLPEMLVSALREVDDTHAAAANDSCDAVWPDPLSHDVGDRTCLAGGEVQHVMNCILD
jgi:hypothetical protein